MQLSWRNSSPSNCPVSLVTWKIKARALLLALLSLSLPLFRSRPLPPRLSCLFLLFRPWRCISLCLPGSTSLSLLPLHPVSLPFLAPVRLVITSLQASPPSSTALRGSSPSSPTSNAGPPSSAYSISSSWRVRTRALERWVNERERERERSKELEIRMGEIYNERREREREREREMKRAYEKNHEDGEEGHLGSLLLPTLPFLRLSTHAIYRTLLHSYSHPPILQAPSRSCVTPWHSSSWPKVVIFRSLPLYVSGFCLLSHRSFGLSLRLPLSLHTLSLDFAYSPLSLLLSLLPL